MASGGIDFLVSCATSINDGSNMFIDLDSFPLPNYEKDREAHEPKQTRTEMEALLFKTLPILSTIKLALVGRVFPCWSVSATRSTEEAKRAKAF